VRLTNDGRHVPTRMKSTPGHAALLFQLQKVAPPTGGK